MRSTFFPTSIYVRKITLESDVPQPLANEDVPFYDCTIQCFDNDVLLGYGGIMDFVLAVGDTYWLNNANLRDMLVMNRTAGNNGEIVLIATVPNEYVEQQLLIKGG